ncbi:MAG: glycosyltransferase family 39 protein [Anaerolineae bacterium]|nr:glycosyltransferase family 39 protein [Anaerolineae bacterium]
MERRTVLVREEAERWALVALLVVALTLRLGALVVWPQPLEGDAVLYDQLATSLVNGYGFSKGAGEPQTAVRGPGYPLFVAGLYTLFGHHVLPVYLVQILLDVLTLLLLYRFARDTTGHASGAFVAAALYALYPPFIQQALSLYSETLYTLLLLVSLWIFWQATQRRQLHWFAICGLVLGVATLVRPVTLLFPIWLGACLWPLRRSVGLWRPTLILTIFFVLIILPWTIRNQRLFGTFVPVSTLSGLNFYQAHVGIDEADALRVRRPTEAISLLRRQLADRGIAPDNLNEAQFDRAAQREALAIIAQHPARYVPLFLNRFLRLWLNVGYYGPPSLASLLLACINGVLLLGMLLAWMRYRGTWWIAALPSLAAVAYFTLFHMAIHAQVRYSFPVVPYVMVFAGYAAIRILPWRVDSQA